MRTIIGLGIMLFIICIYPLHGQAQFDVSAQNAILMEQSTGRVLFSKDAHDKQSIASITKVMTAIIAIESDKLDDVAVASRRAIYTEGSSIYLEQGEEMTIRDLVYGLMLRSGNDAAVAIAEHIGGSVEGFVYLMNEKAKWLGMTNTHFENPHGLEGERHYSTAHDMALLMRYAMDNEVFQDISGTKTYQAETKSYAWHNKNRLLTGLYNYCTGGKTGYTKTAGRTLITSAAKNNMDLIAVTLNAPDEWNDHISMYEWGFENYDLTSMVEKGKRKYHIKGTGRSTVGYFRDEVVYPLSKKERESLHSETYVLRKRHQSQPLLGKKIYYIEEEPIIEIPISAKAEEISTIKSDITNIYKQIVGFR